jgi:hypothetical protein
MINFFKGYKTLIFSVFLAIFGAVQVYLPNLQTSLTPTQYGYCSMVVGVVFAILRVVTNTPITKKES